MRQADIVDGVKPGVTSYTNGEVQRFHQALREMRPANEIVEKAEGFFGVELDRQHKM